MKEFFKGLKVLVGAIIITFIFMPLGFPYTYLHAFYYWIKGRNFKTFFKLIIRQLDGTFAAFGYLMYHFAVALDMLWNVNGELIEDLTTKAESSWFGKKNTTVSTATGREESFKRQKKLGKKFNIFLNWLFSEHSHATDSYKLHKKTQELKSKYFK
tara:strand:+ start:296 stop:763 length:468 start_codon:yes stop_codon:yes gene_type:complete